MISHDAFLADFQSMAGFIEALLAYGLCTGAIIAASTRLLGPWLRGLKQRFAISHWVASEPYFGFRMHWAHQVDQHYQLPDWLERAVPKSIREELQAYVAYQAERLRRKDDGPKPSLLRIPFGHILLGEQLLGLKLEAVPDEQFMFAVQGKARAALQTPSHNLPFFVFLTNRLGLSDQSALLALEWIAKHHPQLSAGLSATDLSDLEYSKSVAPRLKVTAATAIATLDNAAGTNVERLLDKLQRQLLVQDSRWTYIFILAASAMLTAQAARQVGVAHPSSAVWLALSGAVFAILFSELGAAALARLRR
jgi:hypothetical protein